MQIAIFIACCFIIGMLIVVCLELRQLRKDINAAKLHILGNMGVAFDMLYNQLSESIPNTFEYNGNKGKVYHK